MLLADIVSQECRELHSEDILEGCRFVKLHRDVMDVASKLVFDTTPEKIAELSKFTVWPDYSTWIETDYHEGKRMGFLFHGDIGEGENSVRYGYGLIVLEYEDKERMHIPVCYDLEKYEMSFKLPVDEKRLRQIAEMEMVNEQTRLAASQVLRELTDPLAMQLQVAPTIAAIKPYLFTHLALMNSPKLIRTRPVDVDKLNARRLKRGRYPYHPHHEVRLNIDKHVFQITEGQGDGPERALHFVRAHLRFLVHPRYKNVSVVLVPPHWRGNPELGVMNTSYAVGRENSKWPEKA